MKPVAVLLIALAVAALVALIVWWIGRQAGVRQRDFKRLRAERDRLARAVMDLAAAADLYRDIDSVLAAQVRATVRTLESDRLDLYR